MRRALLAASVVFATGLVAVGGLAAPENVSVAAPTTTAAPELPRLLGFADQKLVAVDAETLRPGAGRRVVVGSGGCAPRSGGTACWTSAPWTVSPDGSTLAVVRNDARSLRMIDPRRLRVTSEIPLSSEVGALAWLTRSRILALEEAAGERQRLVIIDVATGRATARRALRGSVVGLERAPQDLVILVAPVQEIGTARLAVADRRGDVRFVRLERIVAGTKLLGTGAQHRVDGRHPGFAVDPNGRRAFVVDASVVAEIDLRTLKVAYHSLSRPRSLLTRLHDWLEPVAAAKQVRGYHRVARWLGGDLLAVSGLDTVEGRTQSAGLVVVNTSEWTVRKIDAEATSFRRADDLLLAYGTPHGLTAFTFDGSQRFRAFDGNHALPWLVYGGLAYVSVGGQERPQIVDLVDGRALGVRQEPIPWLLLGAGGGWWE